MVAQVARSQWRAGQQVDEEALKAGMSGEITYEGDKTAAQKMVCN